MENKKIAILMATYNGERFLKEQLLSIANQTYQNWHLYVMDDGSSDKTWQILKDMQLQVGVNKMTLMQQENQGSANTFLSLSCDPNIHADYYAYSDQDDIWDEDKLSRAVAWISQQDNQKPVLYCANVRLMSAHNKVTGMLPSKNKDFCFRHALVQSIAPGNTMMFNQTLKKLLEKIGKFKLLSMHDWWVYIIATAYNGAVYYDVDPVLSYRQHEHNLVGFSENRFARYLKSFKRIVANNFYNANECHAKVLNKIKDQLPSDSQKTLLYFEKARHGNIFKRLWCLHQSGVYRQDRLGTIGLYVAVLMGKL